MTQCSTSEIGDAPLCDSCSSTDPSYDNWTIASTLKMQIRMVQRAEGDENKVCGHDYGLWCGSSEGHVMPPHIFEVGLKVNTEVYLDVLKSVVIPGAIRWLVADPGVAAGLGSGLKVQRRPRLGFRRSATTLYPSLPSSPDLNPLDYFVWSYVENITNMTSHNTKASLIAAIRPSISRAPTGACGKGMLPVPGPYRGGDWGWRRLHWIDVSSTT